MNRALPMTSSTGTVPVTGWPVHSRPLCASGGAPVHPAREPAPRAYDNSPPPAAAPPAPPPARTAAARPPATPAAPPPPLAANAPAVTVQGSGAINAIDVSSAESTTILTAEQMANIARTALLGAGWPVTIPGLTIDRKCGSGEVAVHVGAGLIAAGEHHPKVEMSYIGG